MAHQICRQSWRLQVRCLNHFISTRNSFFFNLKKAYFHLKQFYNYIFDAPTTQCEEGYRNGRFSNALTIQLGSKNFREMKLKLFANSTSLDTSRNKMSHGFSLYNIRKGQDDQKSEIPLRS